MASLVLLSNKAFVIYCLMSMVLSVMLVALWGYSGGVRGKTKTTPNPEDAGTVAKGATVTDAEPSEVGRVMRVYNNSAANVVPFLVLALLYSLVGATEMMAWILFGGFTAARVLYAFAYLGGKQPWRTIFFVLGQLCILAVVVQLGRIVVGAMM
jgi:microsomal prostaglandin-E synthase 1